MYYKIVLSCMFVLLFSPLLTYSQEWGEISDEVLQMIQFDPDPEADAVILFDIGEIKFFPNFTWEIFRHKRLKILTEGGKEYASIKISYWHDDDIGDIEAVCYHPDGREIELDGDEIYDEETEKWKYKVFTIPGAEVGAVIEYSYKINSENIHHLEPWIFQGQNYTKLSRISVFISDEFDYSTHEMNLFKYELDNTEETVFAMGMNGPVKISKSIWTVKDLQGIKKEPYMTAFKDYYAQILFHINTYDKGYVHEIFAKEWDDAVIAVSKRYAPLLNQGEGIKDFVKKFIVNIKDPELRARKIFDYVRTEIRTTKSEVIVGSNLSDPTDVFEAKAGSINEKNLLLINMLRHAELNANPLLISTRNNGIIIQEWAQLRQFDRVLVYLKIDKIPWYLDTENKYCPFGYLTPSLVVNIGLFVKENHGALIGMQSQEVKGITKIKTDVNVTDQGEIVASTEFKFEEYNAVKVRNQIADAGPKDYFTAKLSDIYKDAILDTFTISDLDSLDKPLVLTMKYKLPDYIQIQDHLHYVKPPYFTAADKNPFKRQTRNIPVDFPYIYTESEIVKIHLPAGLILRKVPGKIETNKKEIVYNKTYSKKDDGFECNRTFRIIKTRVGQSKYEELRLLFDNIVESDRTQIELIQNKP